MATDYVRAVPQLVAEYIAAPLVTLGTDGFGRSGTRREVRAFFEVDAAHIELAALDALAQQGHAGAAAALESARLVLNPAPMPEPPWQR